MQVKWLKRALSNLQEEADYIAKDDPQAAIRTVLRIEEAVSLLADHPSLGRIGRVPGTREPIVPNTPYVVPYRVRGTRIELLRVFHTDPGAGLRCFNCLRGRGGVRFRGRESVGAGDPLGGAAPPRAPNMTAPDWLSAFLGVKPSRIWHGRQGWS